MKTCEDCDGDGKEHCNNPDHNFVAAMGEEMGRLGCPTCDFPRSTVVIRGGNCESCNGTGMTQDVHSDEEFEKWLDRQLTGDLATGNIETELRMAVSTIRGMPNIPKDFAVQPLLRFIHQHDKQLLEDTLFDLDEIDNKPWRVFRQLAKLMPDYEEEYTRYEAFYSYGGGQAVEKLIDEFEKTDDFKESHYAERLANLTQERSDKKLVKPLDIVLKEQVKKDW